MKRTITNNNRFPGQYYDEETGLHYNLNRDYRANLGRYIQADSLGIERGENDLFTYAENSPIVLTDPTGLAVWICSRKTKFGIGNHAYFWDDQLNTCCGMGSTGVCREAGPGKDSCKKIGGSEGREKALMACCRQDADKGLWFPPINDCHEGLDDCLKEAGIPNPGAPGGRLGPLHD